MEGIMPPFFKIKNMPSFLNRIRKTVTMLEDNTWQLSQKVQKWDVILLLSLASLKCKYVKFNLFLSVEFFWKKRQFRV